MEADSERSEKSVPVLCGKGPARNSPPPAQFGNFPLAKSCSANGKPPAVVSSKPIDWYAA
jgi:hypothetical protein